MVFIYNCANHAHFHKSCHISCPTVQISLHNNHTQQVPVTIVTGLIGLSMLTVQVIITIVTKLTADSAEVQEHMVCNM